MASQLTEKKCTPCEGGQSPMEEAQARQMLRELTDGWGLDDQDHLVRQLETDDFKSALELVDRIGELAEQENHHPTITFTWGKVYIELYTHKIDGLSENDFILAAKIDEICGA